MEVKTESLVHKRFMACITLSSVLPTHGSGLERFSVHLGSVDREEVLKDQSQLVA